MHIAFLFAPLRKRWAGLRRRRAARLAIAELLEMDAYRLDDLGLTLEDINDVANGKPLARSRIAAIGESGEAPYPVRAAEALGSP